MRYYSMQRSLEAMRIALRVLSALSARWEPSPADVNELEGLAGPRPFGVPLDEWARDIITQAVQSQRLVDEISLPMLTRP